MGTFNLSGILRDKSLKGRKGEVSNEVKNSLDMLAASVAVGIIDKTAGNPRKMARAFDPMKKYLDSRAKKAPEVLQKKAIAYLKAKIESILRQKVAGE